MSLTIAELLDEYRSRRLDPSVLAARICDRRCEQPIWIARLSSEQLMTSARALDVADRSLPLYGVPFAVKDNIDVADIATTAGCPGFARVAQRTAPAVARLLDAGALLVGKTNMDQFATGLVGTRSPYGACSSVFDSERVSGGSSSGSALAVAYGVVTFALGTDTAGSGRVPAAFNGLVGLKPTRGLISTRGVIPACASLDCVSVFSRSVADAATVLDMLDAFDADDPWSRSESPSSAARTGRIGVPLAGQLEFDEPAAAAAWQASLERACEHWAPIPVDCGPLLAASPLLYAAWIAERAADLAAIVATEPDGLDPTVASLIAGGAARSGAEVFAAMHELASLRAQAAPIWESVDAVLLPTTPGHPTHAAVAADPVGANERLGRFTNFANLFDLSAIAMPGVQRYDGLPFGVTLIAPAFHDRRLLALGAQWRGESVVLPPSDAVPLAVVGAHMSGLELNWQLRSRGARLLRATSTAPCYRLYSLGGPGVPRPGLVRVDDGDGDGDGACIDVEVWELSHAALGSLLCEVPAPLAIGRVALADGSEVSGFVCEGRAVAAAQDITEHGGWRAFLSEAVL